ncbi:hypothetical protein CAEBREN_23320 [Caenorhabditis brenneri]|uniref:Uncharacterized protein n=1 Tax=Caenorhabditis brenneri TaxID=135651 RepID=G0PG61_CAEBE|nr:hypothetical protein CAEBREN_23320 [Caenorhabditis brenneri]
MQSKTHDAQQWPQQLGKASPQGPPAMQEKMLTKSQTSTPTSQPGTTKPHGLINTSKLVRTDPQRNSPMDISTIHNYQLKLKSLDGRDPVGRSSTFFTKKSLDIESYFTNIIRVAQKL